MTSPLPSSFIFEQLMKQATENNRIKFHIKSCDRQIPDLSCNVRISETFHQLWSKVGPLGNSVMLAEISEGELFGRIAALKSSQPDLQIVAGRVN